MPIVTRAKGGASQGFCSSRGRKSTLCEVPEWKQGSGC